MHLVQRVPRLIRWIFSVFLIFLLVMTIFRFLFYFEFNPPGKAFSGSAFIMGLRFDAKFIAMIGLAMLLLCVVPFLNPFKNPGAKRFWNIFLPLLFLIMTIFYCADYYHYDYLHQRLNASVLNYLQDAGISMQMMWQSYPLLKIGIAVILLLALAVFIFSRLLFTYLQKQRNQKRRGIFFYILFFLLLGAMVFGKNSQFPLRWSDAFTLSDTFKANLALNPFQSFFSTLGFKDKYDIHKVKVGYPLIAAYLGIKNPDSNQLNFERVYSTVDPSTKKPNGVVVICESFSAYKSTMFNNPLNTTPFFNSLCDNGIFFDRCFTPAYGTARGVWATITGIPDVESPSTASRNPNTVDQHTIINDFKDYTPYYFLGGDPTWANIQGLLANNINGLHLYQQDDFKAKKIDVWGISDKNLFLEANGILKRETKPFFAIIQTADNHRPYTIPKEDQAVFKKVNFPTDSLKRYGFESNDEMNAFRYTDFCYQQFMDAAMKESYFDNTLFVFVGDHGIRYGGALDYFPKSWVEQGLTCEHVPLLFYAPKLLPNRKIHQVCSQTDILPSVASLANIPYHNHSLGRDLFDTLAPLTLFNEKYAFIIDHDVKTIGLVSSQYYFLKNLRTGKKEFVSVTGNEPIIQTPHSDSIKNYLDKLTDAWYETAKYLLLNNKKEGR